MKNKSRFIKCLTAIIMAVLMIIPDSFAIAAFADNSASNEVVLFEGTATAKGGWSPWNTAVTVTPNADDLKDPFMLAVKYEGNTSPCLIFFVNDPGDSDWRQLSTPSFVSKGVAYYSYEACCEAFKSSDFSKIKNIEVRPINDDLTVTKVSIVPAVSGDVTVTYSGTAGKIVNNINAGWNLGNTFDAFGSWIAEYTDGSPKAYETSWGNISTTKEVIDTVKAAGFNAVRIPITWSEHIKDVNGKVVVDEAWMNRIKEVVDYVIDDGMYCIINVHHDVDDAQCGWLRASNASIAQSGSKFEGLWTEIANTFKDYDNKLLFEGFNEMLNADGNWLSPGDEGVECVNKLNQMFVNTVRATGGNNAERCLVVNSYAASPDGKFIDDFAVPQDTVKDSIIVQIHFYCPYSYANVARDEWTQQTAWKDNGGKNAVDGTLLNLYQNFTSKGIPVIIGEVAAANKDNSADRAEYAKYVVETAYKYGIKCFWWDNGGTFEADSETGYYKEMGLLNRQTLTWEYPEIVQAFTSLGIKPSEEETTDKLLGDVNNDKVIDLMDFVKLQEYLADDTTSLNKANADLNGDNNITIADLAKLKKIILS